MYKIEKTEYGLKIAVSGVINTPEVDQLIFEILKTLSQFRKPFSLILDTHELIPHEPEVLEKIKIIKRLYKQMSVQRVAIVSNSPILLAQGQQCSYETDSTNIERFIDATKVYDWEQQARDWVLNGVEPVTPLTPATGKP